MAATDSPLKQLVESFINEFAAWLLGDTVKNAQPLNGELQANVVRVDLLFRITLGSGRVVRLHIEFQGPRSHEPMPLRMLDYMTRLAKADPVLDLYSVVFYVGEGAGADDTGEHFINRPDGKSALQWRYHVIHLWKMKAEELLALHQPALLPLVGQTKIDKPELILPEIVKELKSVSDDMLRKRLFTGLLALMKDEEAAQMIESMIEKEELLTDTPFLRRIRNEGSQSSSRRDVLSVLKWRFDPPISHYEQIQQALKSITATEQLEELLKLAVQATDLSDFQKGLQVQVNQQATQQTNGERQ